MPQEPLVDDEITRLLGGPPRVTLDEIVRHPRLPQARTIFLDRFLAVYGGDPFLVRLLIETGRFFVYHTVVVLEAAQDPDRRETWVTVGLLKRTLAMLGLSSARQIDHLIARLCAVGYMQSQPSPHDRRVRILSATEKLRAHDRDWLIAHYTPLTVLFPEHDYSRVMQADPQFHTVLRRTNAAFLSFGAKLFAAEREMFLLMKGAGSYMVFAALLQAALAADQLHAAVPYGEVGDRFGISRTQVRNLLREAEQQGFVKLHARGGHRVEILPRMWAVHDRGIACGMYAHDMLYVAASRALTPYQSASHDAGDVREAARRSAAGA
jgi:DNA-binding MarR family transcriptional regulator